MSTLNQVEFARHIGVAKSYVTALKKAGRLVMTETGLVDVEASIARIADTADAGRRDVSERHAEKRGAAIPHAPEAQPANHDAGLGLNLGENGRAKAKAMVMHYENSIIKIEMALRRGMRCERAAVRREAFSIGAMLRAGVERVIDQTAPRLAAASDETERRRILEKETRRLRWMLKRELPRAMRRMREAGAAGKIGAAAE